jgi:hypothetical protein
MVLLLELQPGQQVVEVVLDLLVPTVHLMLVEMGEMG